MSMDKMKRVIVGGLILLMVAAVGVSHKRTTAPRNACHPDVGQQKSKMTETGSYGNPELVTVKATKFAEFDFGDEELKQQLIDSGHYDPKAVVPYDITVDTVTRDRLFVTTPQMRRGVPATLSTVPYSGAPDAQLKPYPGLALHRSTEDTITSCRQQLVSVVAATKTWTDDNTLYAIDSGVLEITTKPKNVCPPKILMFDLHTDEIIKTTEIINAACNSLYTGIVVEACPAGSLVAYSADAFGVRLTVTDLSTGGSKHLHSQYFHPKPGFFFTSAGGPAHYFPFGLCALSADNRCDGKLYLQAQASNVQSALDKRLLHSASDGDILDATTQVALPGELLGPSCPLVLEPTGQLLFFPIEDEMAVYCWNTSKAHHTSNFRMIAQEDERMQYVSSLKIEPGTQRLFIQTNRFTSYLSNTTNYSVYNNFILYLNINQITC